MNSNSTLVAEEVLVSFISDPHSVSISSLGCGNINETFLIQDGSAKWVLQQINRAVFPDPEIVITNFCQISEQLCNSRHRDSTLLCPKPVFTLSGKSCFTDSNGNYWRGQSYIEHRQANDFPMNSTLAKQLGSTLAQFHQAVAPLSHSVSGVDIRNPLPGFHVTPNYLAQYDRAVQKFSGGQSDKLISCFRKVEQYRCCANWLEQGASEGKYSVGIIHGDPKLDNIIFDHSGKARGMFDLDTVGPGLLLYDIGDCLRSCCNSSGENCVEPANTTFDLEICSAILSGYFSIPNSCLNDDERKGIYEAVLVITYELAIRFLTDYLYGNIYFRVTYEEENLDRALIQFTLADSIAENENVIRDFSEMV